MCGGGGGGGGGGYVWSGKSQVVICFLNNNGTNRTREVIGPLEPSVK